ncbi:hypothetical protein HQ447_16155 [bacterium]|nr:hypothetical protein [bacterium]
MNSGETFWRFKIACRVMPTAAADSLMVHPSSSFRKISLPRQSSFMGEDTPNQAFRPSPASPGAGEGTTGSETVVTDWLQISDPYSCILALFGAFEHLCGQACFPLGFAL